MTARRRLRGAGRLPELIYALPGIPLYATISAYYNVGTADTRRGYLNAELQDASRAEASATTSALRLLFDWLTRFAWPAALFSPYASVSQARSSSGHGKAAVSRALESPFWKPIRRRDSVATPPTTSGTA